LRGAGNYGGPFHARYNGGMSDRRNPVSALLRSAASKFLDADSVCAIYMAPGFFCLAAARSRVSGISENFATWLSLGSITYMSLPGLAVLVLFLVTEDTRFRLKVLLIISAIVVIAVSLAFGLSYIIPMPKKFFWQH
jgi:hypothetical protein